MKIGRTLCPDGGKEREIALKPMAGCAEGQQVGYRLNAMDPLDSADTGRFEELQRLHRAPTRLV